MGWVLLAIVLLVIVALYVWYAMIVTRRNRVSEALAGIDVQLQQRHDLIPNVLTIARRFMEHERTLLEEITELRNKANAQAGSRDFAAAEQRFATEKRLEAEMGRLFALAENYPELQVQGPMMEAQRAYSEVEANLSAARRFYNSAVGELRNIVEIFPGEPPQGLRPASRCCRPSSRRPKLRARRSTRPSTSEHL